MKLSSNLMNPIRFSGNENKERARVYSQNPETGEIFYKQGESLLLEKAQQEVEGMTNLEKAKGLASWDHRAIRADLSIEEVKKVFKQVPRVLDKLV